MGKRGRIKDAGEAAEAAGEDPEYAMEQQALQEKETKAAERGWKKDIEKAGAYRSYLEGKAASQPRSEAEIEQARLRNQQQIAAQSAAIGQQISGAMLGAQGQQGQTAAALQALGKQTGESAAMAAITDEQLMNQIANQIAQQSLQNVAASRNAQMQNQATYATAGSQAGSALVGAGLEDYQASLAAGG